MAKVRNGDNHLSAYPAHLLKKAQGIEEVLQDVQSAYRPEGLVLERKSTGYVENLGIKTLVPCLGDRYRRNIQELKTRKTSVLKQVQEQAVTAPQVQDRPFPDQFKGRLVAPANNLMLAKPPSVFELF